MIQGAEIAIFPKGTEYLRMKGNVKTLFGPEQKVSTIMGFMFQTSSSILSSGSSEDKRTNAKIIVMNGPNPADGEEKNKGEEHGIGIYDVYIKTANITCYPMTSLFTFMTPSKKDNLTVVTMQIDGDGLFEPQVNYTYQLNFKYSYGAVGIGFWIQLGILILGLSGIVIYRLIRLISVKSILDSHKILLADFKSSAKKLKGRFKQ